MEWLLAPPQNLLCSTCQRMLRPSRDEKPLNNSILYSGIHHENSHSFFAAGEYGCRLCSILLASHSRRQKLGGNNISIEYDISVSVQGFSVGKLYVTTRDVPETQISDEWQFSFEILEEKHPSYSSLLEASHNGPLTESLDGPPVMELASQWLSNCVSCRPGHETCGSRIVVDYSPKRLLCVRDIEPRLSLKEGRTKTEAYCALSYCWGKEPIEVALNIENEAEYCNQISLMMLPKTIQDAIFVTRQLGIKFLWIDCLCIIQHGDDGADWIEHSLSMKDIYANCTLNLSVDRATCVADGFLFKRDWPCIRPIFFTHPTDSESELPKRIVVNFPKIMDVVLATEPLASRGWVLSERILAPRTLHFASGELFWECVGTPLASESCPSGHKIAHKNDIYSKYNLPESILDRDLHQTWLSILTNYSQLSLTYPSKDKLVALAGVFHRFEEISEDVLFAGIVKSALPSSLLWRSCGRPAPTYRAPSWSWASIDGPLLFYHWTFDEYGHRSSKNLAEFLDARIKHMDENNRFSQILSGTLTLRGPLISANALESQVWRSRNRFESLLYSYDDSTRKEAPVPAMALFLRKRKRLEVDSFDGILLTPQEGTEYWVRLGIVKLRTQSEEDPTIDPERLLDIGEMKTVIIK